MRTFLLAALGNSFNQAHPGGKVVAALDIQPAESLAPAIGITYLPNLLGTSGAAEQIKEAWARIRGNAARLFLFNGVWSQAPELWEEIAGCAGGARSSGSDDVRKPFLAKHDGTNMDEGGLAVARASGDDHAVHALPRARRSPNRP